MSKNMRTACFSLSLSLRQPARPVGRAFLHTTTVIVTSLVHQWRPLSFSLSLTHDACCLSWFPFCSSFCHVHCCCYGRERERERERYLYVEQVRERKKENWLHVPYLEVDYSIATYKIEIGIKVFFGFCPLLEHHPIHLLSVRWAEAELGVLEGVWEGGPWDIRPCPTPYRIFTKKVFFRNSSKRFWRQNWATRKLWKWAKNEIGFGTPVTFLSFNRATAFQIPVKFETWRFRPMCQINKIGSFSDSLSGNYELS